MHFIIGFAILVVIFSLFTRMALLFTGLIAGGAVLLFIVAAIAQSFH